MQNNRQLQISTAGSRKALQWPRSTIMWSDFVGRLKTPVRSTETLEQYMAYPKAKRDELKDVGGYVGGTLAGDRRLRNNVEGRDLLTLDLDNIPAGGTDDILKRVGGLGCAAAVYSTRKHAGYAPRLRVIVPLDRTAKADEYEPAARKLAALLGIGFCDPTTFEPQRLMYWPSCCADGEYVYEVYDNPFCYLDGLLGMYADWKDVTSWPQVPSEAAIDRQRLAKQEDPTTKRGIVGAFCRTYTITQAMDKFIAGMYEPTAMPGRYTYTGGETTGGAIVYDGDMFLYSHHSHDPCSKQLVNAFDLVRLHMYGDRDAEAKDGTPNNRLPSFVAMGELAHADKAVTGLLAAERAEEAKQAFAAPGGVQEATEAEDDTAWTSRIALDGNGNFRKTVNNMLLVLQNDPRLKGRIVTDEFAGRGLALGALPWNPSEEKRQWTDVDSSGLFWFLEEFYGTPSRDRMYDALAIAGEQNKINDVRDYLKGLKWDGVKRLDTLLADYLGAEDTPYTRAVIRKSLCAAVARAVVGGVKYDNMPIIAGPPGIGKSTLLSTLGGAWFSDSLTSFEGRDAVELIQGTWINEVGELTAFSKQGMSAIKQFLSKQFDLFRAPYGRAVEKRPRRCVFFGTSNAPEFLSDPTGSRRFWPVDTGIHPMRKSIWDDLPEEVGQIWAEAYMYWALGEPLYLSRDIEALALEQQESHRETSGKEGIIRDFLERKVPTDWDQQTTQARRMFWGGGGRAEDGMDLIPREKVCPVEIWVECLGGDPKYMTRKDSNEIVGIMLGTPGWKRNRSTRRYGPYGAQKGFERG